VLKDLLGVLAIVLFVCLSAIAAVYTVQTFCDLTLLQAEHDLAPVYDMP
jgi:hypothetical protein